MNHKKAYSALWYIINNQKTVSTAKIKKEIQFILGENKMLKADNRSQRKKVKKLQHQVKRMEDRKDVKE